MISKARNRDGEGGGGVEVLGDNKTYHQQDQEALEMFPRCLDRQRRLVSREC